MEDKHTVVYAPDKRDQTLDILKGLGIILMVLGHSGAPFESYIYLFHMALFFMASGYVWNDRKVDSLPALGKSILSRFRGLWLPYVLANGSFTLLSNLLVHLGIYGQKKLLSLPQMGINLAKNLLFAGDTQMGGASWFLRCLFFISIAHLLLRYIVVRIKGGKVLFGAVALLTFVGAAVINRTRWSLPMGIESCFCGYSAFLMGMALRKVNFPARLEKYCPLAAIGGFGILLLLDRIDNIGMGVGNISSLPFFIVASLSGWVLIWGIASLIKGPFAGFLRYCGRHSVWIVMLHFISFKPVAWLYLTWTGGDLAGLSAFPVFEAPWLWIAYTVAGTLLPLLLCFGVDKLSVPVKKLFRH